MKFLKKNQILVYVIALMLVAAGYLNYTTTGGKSFSSYVETVADSEKTENENSIGDAQLVNANEENDLKSSDDVKLIEEEKDDSIETSSKDIEDEYFKKSRLERETMYSQMLDTYEKVLNGINSLEVQKQSASQEIKKINDIKNSIMICENLIETKGFKKSVIFVNGNSVSLIIGAKEIEPKEIAQLQNIISRELNVNIENIHIALK